MRHWHRGAVVCVLSWLASPAMAAVLHLPSEWPTVRAAVNAAATGDTILIAPGRHDGGAFVTGKSLTIASHFLTDGDPALIVQTILAGARLLP